MIGLECAAARIKAAVLRGAIGIPFARPRGGPRAGIGRRSRIIARLRHGTAKSKPEAQAGDTRSYAVPVAMPVVVSPISVMPSAIVMPPAVMMAAISVAPVMTARDPRSYAMAAAPVPILHLNQRGFDATRRRSLGSARHCCHCRRERCNHHRKPCRDRDCCPSRPGLHNENLLRTAPQDSRAANHS